MPPTNRMSGRFERPFTASVALKKSLRFFIALAILMALISVGISRLFTEDVVIQAEATARANLMELWRSYQHYYIKDGRVTRPKNDFDTVSEGQAYAMLRAVWLDDRKTFDEVYRWTEANLSRSRSHGDHLLSWRYGIDRAGGNSILDANPALDADLDYALALFAAARKWNDNRSPVGTQPYREKALAVTESIMSRGVILLENGELALLPWPAGAARGDNASVLLNPSYFSPGHYRVFDIETGNRRWGKLAADTYQQIGRLLDSGDSLPVTVPDWIQIQPEGSFTTDPSRGYVSGWDAFRLWWRLRLDFDLSGAPRAADLIKSRLTAFVAKSMEETGGDVAAESNKDGTPIVKSSNAGMSAVYSWALRGVEPALSRSLQRQTLRRLQQDGDYLYFQDKSDYYTNSWAWLAMTEGSSLSPIAGLFAVQQGQGEAGATEGKR